MMPFTILDRVLALSDLLQKDMARAFAGTGLTTARVQLLWLLHHAGPSTQQDLARSLEVSARNITGLVDALEQAGYVIRKPHPSDRRAVSVTLTEAGEAAMAEMTNDYAALSTELIAAIAPADLPAVERGLDALTRRTSELMAEHAENEAHQ